MEEITLRTDIQIRNNANLRVINIHHRKLGHTPISPDTRIINRPERLRRRKIGVRISVGVEVGDERDEPVFHVFGDGGVICVCKGGGELVIWSGQDEWVEREERGWTY
jgi:hypothetical protein